jgi:hypothetical protein
MRKAICIFSKFAALVILLFMPMVALAKAPTVKVTISGGGLTNIIEVTDPALLAISDIWQGQFLDRSRSPLDVAPTGLTRYEVSFYAKLSENKVRKMYVVYYYPNLRTEQGFIYLPGEGPLRQLNIGTVYRSGQDGKWNYALPAWESLIKPVLARARAASSSVPKPEAVTQKGGPLITMPLDRWTKPQSGCRSLET